jgi:hypothetical protein
MELESNIPLTFTVTSSYIKYVAVLYTFIKSRPNFIYIILITYVIFVEIKVGPFHGCAGTEGRRNYNSYPFANLALEGVLLAPRPVRFTPWKEAWYFRGRYVDLGESLEGLRP